MRQLLKDDGVHGHGGHGGNHGPPSHANHMSNEDLKRILKIQTDPSATAVRKRGAPFADGDDSTAAKRSDSRTSSLRDQNRMLASLLENPPKPVIPTVPAVKTIPDITSSTVNSRSGPALGGHAKNIGPAPGTQPIVGPGSGRAQQRLQQQQQQQQAVMQAAAALQQRNALNATANTATSVNASSGVLPSGLQQQHNPFVGFDLNSDDTGCDSELSKLLDSVIDAVDDNSFAPSTPNSESGGGGGGGLTPQDNYESMAISAIQRKLMVETSVYRSAGGGVVGMQQGLQAAAVNAQQRQMPQPPAYPGSLTPQQQQQQQQMLQLLRSKAGTPQQQQNVQHMLEVMQANQQQQVSLLISSAFP